jgi:hypothetical protein
MTNAQIVALGVRLFCVWLAVYLLRQMPGLWGITTEGLPDTAAAMAVAGFTGVMILLIVGLWLFPLFIARKLLPQSTLDQPTPLPLEQAQRVGFCLLGLWLLTEALPRMVYAVVMVYYSAQPNTATPLQPHNYAGMAQMLIELCLGIWLLFGARGLAGLLRWARVAGTPEPSNSTAESDARESSARGSP